MNSPKAWYIWYLAPVSQITSRSGATRPDRPWAPNAPNATPNTAQSAPAITHSRSNIMPDLPRVGAVPCPASPCLPRSGYHAQRTPGVRAQIALETGLSRFREVIPGGDWRPGD